MSARRPGRLESRQPGVKLLLLLVVAVGLAPYLFMVTTSFKSNEQFIQNYWAPAWPLHLENFARAWDQVAPYLGNSLFIALVSSVLTALIASIAAFVLSRYRFRGRGVVYGSIVLLMAVPGIASLIPMFILMRNLGLLNTYAVLVIPYVASGLVLGTVVMRNTIESIPQSIYDAARVDGAGPVLLYRSITLPLALPAVGTVSLLTLSGVWNDFFWPLLVVTDNKLRTVSVGLQFFQGQNAIDYGPLMAGYLIASLPLVALFVPLSKYFLAGVQGGVAGAH